MGRFFQKYCRNGLIMELKVNDNITILIEWKGWHSDRQNNEYIQKTRTIVDEFDKSAKIGFRGDFKTLIKMKIPHRELESYTGMEDNEHAYDFELLYRLIARLKADDDVQAIFVELSKYEKAGYSFACENIPYNIMEYDNEENPSLIRIYPYVVGR